mmetsp:Transcript_2349/g.5009  ORF Transcript_2349/g.5009 Transcript_2349/m.5009 type:complete len:118 (+) Transcript_2349:371-724(+)
MIPEIPLRESIMIPHHSIHKHLQNYQASISKIPLRGSIVIPDHILPNFQASASTTPLRGSIMIPHHNLPNFLEVFFSKFPHQLSMSTSFPNFPSISNELDLTSFSSASSEYKTSSSL